MKKVASLVGAGAMLFGMALPTFACTGMGCWWDMFKNDTTITNVATVGNDVDTKADTGDNKIGGWWGSVMGAVISTGGAVAGSSVDNDVNTNGVAVDCDCVDDLTITNVGTVWNDVYTKADTGDNKIGGWWTTGAAIGTGMAGATSILGNVVNTNLVGGI